MGVLAQLAMGGSATGIETPSQFPPMGRLAALALGQKPAAPQETFSVDFSSPPNASIGALPTPSPPVPEISPDERALVASEWQANQIARKINPLNVYPTASMPAWFMEESPYRTDPRYIVEGPPAPGMMEAEQTRVRRELAAKDIGEPATLATETQGPPSIVDRANNAMIAFRQGTGEWAAAMPKVAAMIERDIADKFTGNNTDLKNYALWRFGQGISKFSETPLDPRQGMTNVLAKATGNLAPTLATAGLGQAALGLEAMGSLALQGAAQGAVSTYEEAKAAGASEDTAVYAASVSGVLNGAAMSVGGWNILRKFDETAGGAIRKALVKAGNAGVVGVENTGIAAVQQMGSNEIAKLYDKDRKTLDGVLEAAGTGGLLGSIAHGVVSLVRGLRPNVPAPIDVPPPTEPTQLVDTGPSTPVEIAQAVSILSPEGRAAIVPAGPPRPLDAKAKELPDADWAARYFSAFPEQLPKLAAMDGPVKAKDVQTTNEPGLRDVGRSLHQEARNMLPGFARDLLKGQENAAQTGQQRQGGVVERPGTGAVGPPAETGGSDRVIDRGKVPQVAQEAQAGGASVGAPAEPVEVPGGEHVGDVTPPTEPTSLKNAVKAAERIARGLSPIEQKMRISNPQAFDDAKLILEANTHAGYELVSSLNKEPRTITPEENFVIALHQQEVQGRDNQKLAELAYAQDQGDDVRVAQLTKDHEVNSGLLNDIDEAARLGGTAWSAAGHARQAFVGPADYSPSTMTLRERADRGRALTPKEIGEVAAISQRIEETRKAYAESDVVDKKSQADQAHVEAVAEIVKDVAAERKPRSKRYIQARANFDAAIAEFLAEGQGKLFSLGGQLESIPSLVKVAKAGIELGLAKFEDFIAAVRKKIGDEKADKAKDALEVAWKMAIEEARPKAHTELANKSEVADYARKLSTFFVERGIATREENLDAVHGELAKAVPGITRDQSREAIARYGVYKPLDMAPVKVIVRDIKGQLLQIAKLKEMEAGRAAQASGNERPAPSDAERQLIQQVNEMKKKGGFVVTDPAKELQSALASKKTWLTNRIADLKQEISTRTKNVKKKNVLKLDVETQKLQTEYEALKKTHAEIFYDPTMTDEQRTAVAIKAAERSAIEWERKAQAKDLSPLNRGTKVKMTPALEAIRARRDAAKAEVQQLRNLADPKKTPDERATDAMDAALTRRLADYQDRIARGDYEPKPRKPAKPSAQTEHLRFEAEKAAADWRRRGEKIRLANRTVIRKIADTSVDILGNVTRGVMLGLDFGVTGLQGGFMLAGHPVDVSRAFFRAMEAFKSEAGESRIAHMLSERPNAKNGLDKIMRIQYSDPHGKPRMQEETLMSILADKIPILRNFNRWSSTFLNIVRAHAVDRMAGLGSNGKLTDAEARVIGDFINIATGRGNFGKFNGALSGLNMVFLAPRYSFSRFQLLFGGPFYRGDAITRTLIAKEYGRTLLGTATMLGLTRVTLQAIYGDPGPDKYWNMGWNPSKKEFGLRIGARTIDPFFGMRQTVQFVSRIGGSLLGVKALKVDQPWDTVTNFGRSRLNIIPGSVASRLKGTMPQSYKGHVLKATWENIGKNLITPVNAGDIVQSMKGDGVPAEQALGLLNVIGINVKTDLKAEAPETYDKKAG